MNDPAEVGFESRQLDRWASSPDACLPGQRCRNGASVFEWTLSEEMLVISDVLKMATNGLLKIQALANLSEVVAIEIR